MKTRPLAWAALGGLLTVAPACAQEPAATPTPAATPAAPASPAPAATTRVYVFTLLRKGPSWTPATTPELQALQERHLANIRRLGEEGKLAAAGPCGDGDLRGIFVFATDSLTEAQTWAESDPAVQAGRLRLESRRFLGTPGIGRRVKEESAQAGKTELVEYQLALVRQGPRFDPKETDTNRVLFQARNAWMEQLQAAGRLVLSGPFLDGGALGGLLVLRAGSLDAARTLLADDPAVKTERLVFDIDTWWLPKGTLE